MAECTGSVVCECGFLDLFVGTYYSMHAFAATIHGLRPFFVNLYKPVLTFAIVVVLCVSVCVCVYVCMYVCECVCVYVCVCVFCLL